MNWKLIGKLKRHGYGVWQNIADPKVYKVSTNSEPPLGEGGYLAIEGIEGLYNDKFEPN